MTYQINDCVVHPTHGVGHVVALVSRRFFDAESRMYYEIAIQRNTVWVPVDAVVASGLRPLMAKTELEHYRQVLRSCPSPLTPDHHQRHLELRKRLKTGLLQDLCEVMRDLSARRWRKPLTEQDTSLFRRVRDSVCVEWAAISEVPVPAAAQEIDELLQEGQRLHQK